MPLDWAKVKQRYAKAQRCPRWRRKDADRDRLR